MGPQLTANSLCSGQGYMNAGDSAEAFMLIHALRRERLPALSAVLRSKLLSLLVSPVGQRSQVLLSVLNTPVVKGAFGRNLVGGRHTSPAAV